MTQVIDLAKQPGRRLYVIYHDPTGLPGVYIVRGWTAYLNHSEPDPDEMVKTAPTLEAARDHIPQGFVWLPRHPTDNVWIVENWVPDTKPSS